MGSQNLVPAEDPISWDVAYLSPRDVPPRRMYYSADFRCSSSNVMCMNEVPKLRAIGVGSRPLGDLPDPPSVSINPIPIPAHPHTANTAAVSRDAG